MSPISRKRTIDCVVAYYEQNDRRKKHNPIEIVIVKVQSITTTECEEVANYYGHNIDQETNTCMRN